MNRIQDQKERIQHIVMLYDRGEYPKKVSRRQDIKDILWNLGFSKEQADFWLDRLGVKDEPRN